MPLHNETLLRVKGETMSAENNMSDEFYDWLNECPVQWFRIGVAGSSIEYSFTIPQKEEK